jgi:hypothetical protein
MKYFSQAIALLALGMSNAHEHGSSKPKQGVFVLSNQPENEVGVYESLDDGHLSWVGSYPTGGIGYPEPESQDNLDSLGSSNSVSYFVHNGKQYLVAANAGGPEGDASISLMEVHPMTLELTTKSVTPLEGIFTCSVAAYQDRVCAVTCAGSVTMECFRISDSDETLVPDGMHDFGATLPTIEDQPNAVSAAYGPGNILFSDDGKQVGIIMKGDAALEANSTFAPPKAGLHVFSVDANGYGEPAFLALPDASLPFAFTWRSGELETTNQIAVIVNIAGENQDFPHCDESASCRSTVQTILSEHDAEGNIVLSKVDEINADQVDLCWLDYRFGHWYTGNFFSDSVTIGTVSREGVLSLERNSPIGRGTIPNNVAHMGRKIDGSFFLYTENQGTAEVGVNRVIENESFQLEVMVGAPYPDGITGDAWQGAHGIATTLLSEEELFSMYDYQVMAKDNNAKEDKDESHDDMSSSADSIDTIMWGAAASLAVLMM